MAEEIDSGLRAFYIMGGILVPAIAGIIIAIIKSRPKRHITKDPPTELDTVKGDLESLKLQLERQHIKIDDLSERLAWLEGRESKR